ncbi:MAG: class I SAM-dependent methyltransferase [Nitriliruptorales bacterium]
MGRRRTVVILLGTVAAAVAVRRHGRHAHSGRKVPGGLLVSDVGFYDAGTRMLLGSFYRGIAADVVAVADGVRVLEVGCGPGHLTIRLAREHGFDVTGLDLDPAMIERARANADRSRDGAQRRPTFLVGDVASLAFPDGSFDLVVSTLSMHHWDDPRAGLAEIGRVLRPDGRALVWDLRPGLVPFHAHVLDPVQHTQDSPLRVLNVTPWQWPWRFRLTQRIELVPAPG